MLLLMLLALLTPLLPEKVMTGLAITILLGYSMVREVRIGVANIDAYTSYFNSLLLSAGMLATTLAGTPKIVVGAAIFITAFHGERNPLKNIAIFTACGLAYFIYFRCASLHFAIAIPDLNYLFFLALTGSLAASLVESVKTENDKRLTLLLAVATTYLIFNIYALKTSLPALAMAFSISFVLSLAAMKSGVADESGLLSATLIGTLVIVFTNIEFFLVLLAFYAIGSASTRYRFSLKLQRGIAESAGGARGYANVFSNSIAGLFFAINFGFYGLEVFSVAFVASIAAALGDTMASEIGKTSERVYLITNLKRVQPGISGGISLKGEAAALFGCLIVAIMAVLLRVIAPEDAAIAVLAGFVGVHVDSLLGATLEKKGWLTNASVNFLATLSAGLFCLLAQM